MRCLHTNYLSAQNKMVEIGVAVCDSNPAIIAFSKLGSLSNSYILNSLYRDSSHIDPTQLEDPKAVSLYTLTTPPSPIMLHTFPSVHNYDTMWFKFNLPSNDTFLLSVV